ncbi:MAG: type III toxin-antitoxin system ToxN/AbiQ family toxin [Clostridia bacterium]|nr:type III toxin-antitoxin system ToxN/AbiQ family toxin [Clostridia bacterium]
MVINLKIVRINSRYCDYLRKFDSKVPYNKNEKELRPFIGVLFRINDYEYFAPLSSPKPKHKTMKNTIDFFKIKNGELGAVNFNNMLPVDQNHYTLLNLDERNLSLAELKYQKLLKEQLQWLNANYHQVRNKSSKLYQLYISRRLPENIKKRCCNFRLLEEKYIEYNKNIE